MPLPNGMPDYVVQHDVPDPMEQNCYVAMRHIKGAPLMLDDNVLDTCTGCGHDVERRPVDLMAIAIENQHGPIAVICMACAELRLATPRGRA